MSEQVSLPKFSSILQEMKIKPKSDKRTFCMKAFNSETSLSANGFHLTTMTTSDNILCVNSLTIELVLICNSLAMKNISMQIVVLVQCLVSFDHKQYVACFVFVLCFLVIKILTSSPSSM